jgi:hypothetical protein
LAKVCTLQELQDRVFNKEVREDVFTNHFSDTAFSKLYRPALWHNNKMRSSFLYQLDRRMESRGFNLNRQPISPMLARHVVKARRVISNAEADRLSTQRAEAKVEAYFEGRLSDSIEDKLQKELLDCKLGLLRKN